MKDPRDTVVSLSKIIFAFFGALAGLIIILAIVKLFRAKGEQAKIKGAKKLLMVGIIGLIIVLLIYGISTLVLNGLLMATS